MKMRYFILIFCSFYLISNAQVGGKFAFNTLNLASNARVAGIGGDNISVLDNDPNLYFHNPALLNKTMLHRVGVNFSPHMAGIFNTAQCYAFNVKKLGLFGLGAQVLNYGTAKRTDENGVEQGRIQAYDMVLQATHARTLGNFTLGASFKLIGSHIAGYNTFGTGIDLGAMFKHPKRDFTIGITVRNIGFGKNALPINALIGMSYKLEHMPLRFSLTIHHLNNWKIAYIDPSAVVSYDINNNPIRDTANALSEIPRHLIFGGEFLLSKGFNIRVGYNHMRRAELKPSESSILSGFTLGFMLKVKSFELAYTRAFFHPSDGIDMLSLIWSLDNFIKKVSPKTEETNIPN